MKKEKIVVIGNGMAGYKFCEKLTETSDRFEITVFGEEPYCAYDRVHLSDYFNANKSIDDLLLQSRKWYEEQGIVLHTGDRVISIDRPHKSLKTQKGLVESYDYLVFATGSSCFTPKEISCFRGSGVIKYRSYDNLCDILKGSMKSKAAVVVGGGLLGLEIADILVKVGLDTHVIEMAPFLMARQLDETGSKFLKDTVSKRELKIHTGTFITSVIGEEKVTGVTLKDGQNLETDMIILSAGIVPRDELARKIELEVGERGGIVVNEYMQTSDPCIFAIGECALFEGMVYGLVAPCYDMAEKAAKKLVNEKSAFTGADLSTKLKLAGVEVAVFGDAKSENAKQVFISNEMSGIYRRLNIDPETNRLLGGILVGDSAGYNMLSQLQKNNMELPENPESLIVSGNADEIAGAGVDSLPDEAVICSCENVLKGDLFRTARESETCSFDEIKKKTKAGSGCGGCIPMVKDVVAIVLREKGMEVNHSICEHFDYTRQELLDLIKVHGLTDFYSTIEKVGKGGGCEICKPLVASLLASTQNESLTKHASIQDTNDRFFANIQRGGTYSVVPRIPGGEITPEKLIVIGKVAKKYNLYCKITGGQRIDLFGAPVNQLPQIWEELIEAGFESGHAYGKSVRTVKSCVGTTWCRFGVQDSVKMALYIENRYKGIRAPHKIKMAVSGCIRECAEAQSKDIGVIATEKGWNLFVCGNGGSKPRHASLLANDLDDQTLIRYIDRFIMFYIRTAEHLNRTAVWVEKIEGGLDYIKKVIIQDSLNIAEELEKEMEVLVQSYECEWTAVVKNKDLQKRFQHFINSPEPDPTLSFKVERKQKFPSNYGEIPANETAEEV